MKMAEIIILLSPNLKIFSMKCAAYLMERLGLYETLFLNIPKEMERFVSDLAEGLLSYELFMHDISTERLIPEPVESWEYTAEPLLRILPNLKSSDPELEIHCYSAKKHEFLLNEIAIRMACLTLQTAMTGRVNVGEWIELLEESLRFEREILAKKKSLIVDWAYGKCICLSSLSGKRLKETLSQEEHLVTTKYIGGVYHFTPLEILERRWRREFLSGEEIERLVRCHLEYIRDYIYVSSNLDKAYYQWVHDKVPWLRTTIDLGVIRFLDFLTH